MNPAALATTGIFITGHWYKASKRASNSGTLIGLQFAQVCKKLQIFLLLQSGPEVAAGCFPQSCRLLWNVPVSLLCGCPGWDWPLKMKNNNPPWWFAWLKKVTVCGEPPGCGQQWVTVVRHGRHVANPLPPSLLWMLKLLCVWECACPCNNSQRCQVCAQCLCLLFLLSLSPVEDRPLHLLGPL